MIIFFPDYLTISLPSESLEDKSVVIFEGRFGEKETSFVAATMGGTSAISDVSMRGTGRLVLVESCNNVMMDVKEPEKQGGVGGEGEVLRLTDKSEDVADFQDLTQKLEVKTEDFMVKFQEISHKLSDLMEGQKKILECQNFIKTFQDQMEALQEQVRELQVNLLKDHLTVHSAGSSNSLLGVKQEITFKPQDQVFQTPRKTIEQPLRHDVTPVSICSDSDHQPAGKMMMNSRRSLVFPKSLEAMLENKENCGRTNTRMTPRHPLNDGPVPKLSLVGEVRNDAGTDDSPRRDSNLGLLVLADAALTRKLNSCINKGYAFVRSNLPVSSRLIYN